jgi:hypothetical protein
MNRRSFVRTTAIGAFGLGFNPDLTVLSGFQQHTVKKWLHDLVDFTGAKRRSGALEGADSLRAKTTELNAYFTARGYAPESNSVYFYHQNEACCFYALYLRHAASGLTDLLLPVLSRDASGNWHHIATLTGFQLEALAMAAGKLKEHALPGYMLLLPAPAMPQILPIGRFNTSAGSVVAITRLSDTSGYTTLTVTSNQNELLNTTFDTRHCLKTTQI